jgi:hypothetical protein
MFLFILMCYVHCYAHFEINAEDKQGIENKSKA